MYSMLKACTILFLLSSCFFWDVFDFYVVIFRDLLLSKPIRLVLLDSYEIIEGKRVIQSSFYFLGESNFDDFFL